MTQAITRPMVAATAAKTREFFRQLIVSVLANTPVQLDVVKFVASRTLFPISILKDVVRIVTKGRTTTITAKSETRTVMGMRQARRSTIAGRTDLPETVMYCFLASRTSEINRTIRPTTMRNTARPVASFMPVCPCPTYSTMRVVTVFTLPGIPMMDGMP